MSHEIHHEIGVKPYAEDVYKVLTDPKMLAQWWTSDTRGNGTKTGDVLEFWFGEHCQKFEVVALTPGKLVKWKAPVDGKEEWDGTEITFQLSTDDDQTWVNFKHSGWKENTGMLAHCSMKWAVFMLSLKDLLEKGKGQPFPNDIQINQS